MCLLLPFLINKKKKSDRAKYDAEAGRAPRPVADGFADRASAPGQRERGQGRPMGVSSG